MNRISDPDRRPARPPALRPVRRPARRWPDPLAALRRRRARQRLLAILEDPHMARDIGLPPRERRDRRRP
ncbi:hypothetical protein [Acidimangrovimonas sediminis]|uniref:hypothetical protein n=1 Tax=Acidimangrovimonas sediminis TaxID=2056283 RepID=UPI0011AEF2BE|nr:hypothetical protein [Acidimangrovimonas sediminis]